MWEKMELKIREFLRERTKAQLVVFVFIGILLHDVLFFMMAIYEQSIIYRGIEIVLGAISLAFAIMCVQEKGSRDRKN